ncbi:MAG TPA: 1,4-dihydroxy-2-naphthoate polyprenyltransferase [Stenomitos sp.]
MSATLTQSKVQIWLLASRPKTLPAALVPVLVGGALAYGDRLFAAGPFLAAVLGALLIQIGTNFANDYFDFVKGADTEERMGPTRVTQSGLVTPRQTLIATAVAFALATLVGLYLVLVGGWPIVAIGVLSILSGLAYTGGPFPLGYNGLGELFVMIFFGFVAVLGTYFVQAHAVTPLAWWVAVPVGLLSSAILVVNNYRDIQTDRKAGKRTLAARFGERFAKVEYGVFVFGAYLVPLALVGLGKLSWFALLPLLTLPLAAKLMRSMLTESGPVLNKTLAGTGKLLLFFGVLLSIGLVR